MQRKVILPVVATILALVTTLAIVQYLQSLRGQVTVAQPVKTEAVVVARTDIQSRTVINAAQLELRQMPATAIHPRAARRIEDVVSRVALAPIYADQQVVLNALAPVGVNAGLSYVLPKDMRAMTIPVNEVIDVAGFVFPGDRVDVIGTVSVDSTNLSKIFLQDVPVLAVAQTVEQKPGEQARVTTSATLALTPDQAEMLAQIDNNGKIRLALRPSGLSAKVETSGKTTQGALGLRPTLAVAAAVANPPIASQVRGSSAGSRSGLSTVIPAVNAAKEHTVEIWRATEKSVVHF